MKASLVGMVITLAALQFAPPPPAPPPPPQRGQAAAPAAPPAPLTAAECKCSVDITVKRSTGEPISDVDITVVAAPTVRIQADANGRTQVIDTTPQVLTTPLTARTDATGHVVFRDLAEAIYTVRAQRDGYLGAPVPGLLNAAGLLNPVNALSVTVNVGPMANNVNQALLAVAAASNAANSIRQPNHQVSITMIQGATISGRVQDSNRRPVSGVQVAAFRVTYRDGQRTLAQAGPMVQTDDRGEYRLFWFAPGEYYIRTGTVLGALLRTQGYPTQTYYPGTLDASRAVPIVLREGQESGGADFVIQSSTGVTVSGNIVNNLPGGRVNPNGQVNRSITSVFLVPRNSSFMDNPQTLPNINAGARGANPDGINTPFEIRNVPPGSYDFYPMFNDPGPDPVAGGARGALPSYYTGRTPIEVGSDDVKGITAVIRSGVDLKGHVTVTGTPPAGRTTQPATMANLRFQFRPIDNLPSFALGNPLLSVDENGLFTLPNLIDARYILSLLIGAPVDAYVSDMRIGSQSVYDDGVITIGKGSPDMLEIVITRGGGTVQGVLHDGQQKPVASTRVVLIPEQPRRQNFLLYKTAQSNAMGNFTISGVAPGAYKLFAWENIPQGAEQNAEFIREFELRGTSVIVSAGVVGANVQVPVIPDRH